MHRPLYIIPARGGSKGIPRKNIRPLAGRPLIAYSIDVALELAAGDTRRVVLSTDDDEIAATARSLGLPVDYMRPAALATDTAGSREVMLDAMDWADARGIDYDCVVLLQPTSPLRTAADVRAALELYTPEADMVVSVEPAACNPYYNCFETAADGTLRISKGDGLLTRRQDAPEAWTFNGAVYVINPASLRAMPMGAFPRRIPSVMPPERSVDLDTPRDWIIAEALFREL
ncbi:MAG: acylneuraminate cytidylyltransferase family protein [Muribaculaceae bacterium]|nr:acylneuraminate cytidylyltransferase family protein [Muribaculaceae bacterium]